MQRFYLEYKVSRGLVQGLYRRFKKYKLEFRIVEENEEYLVFQIFGSRHALNGFALSCGVLQENVAIKNDLQLKHKKIGYAAFVRERRLKQISFRIASRKIEMLKKKLDKINQENPDVKIGFADLMEYLIDSFLGERHDRE